MLTAPSAARALDDVRVQGYEPLISPKTLAEEKKLTREQQAFILQSRQDVTQIIRGVDTERLLVIVGPCSIHDPLAAVEYAQRLKEQRELHRDALVVVMRAYFEKPRTTVGWKGLINDPQLDGSFKINQGLRTARGLLCDLTAIGVPVGCELLDTISPQFLGDLITWGAIGARTTESQLHRELASGVSFPVGFKNGTDGEVQVALDAIQCAAQPHRFLGVTHEGWAAITKTQGNGDCHVILRGGRSGPNYDAVAIGQVKKEMEKRGLFKLHVKEEQEEQQQQQKRPIIVDCSHGNSLKDFRNQMKVVQSVVEQLQTDRSIAGVMIESNLVEGQQKIGPHMVYGQSVTDGCVGWDTTVEMLRLLAEGVRSRRLKN